MVLHEYQALAKSWFLYVYCGGLVGASWESVLQLDDNTKTSQTEEFYWSARPRFMHTTSLN